jgi:hypothetical protein
MIKLFPPHQSPAEGQKPHSRMVAQDQVSEWKSRGWTTDLEISLGNKKPEVKDDLQEDESEEEVIDTEGDEAPKRRGRKPKTKE